ncbi:unnamed protein product [Somion occarium]|uniref:HMG box domain-containing protein n=1 Tax=Somion occarium TaxID=3059160 RepID=A0ABP1E5K6_9APHY
MAPQRTAKTNKRANNPANEASKVTKVSTKAPDASERGSQEPNKIPRPPNSFILYRSRKLVEMAQCKTSSTTRQQANLSKEISLMWHEESDEVKARYTSLAKAKAEEHKIKYPGYKYCPGKGKKRKSAVKRSSSEMSGSSCSSESSASSQGSDASCSTQSSSSRSAVPKSVMRWSPVAIPSLTPPLRGAERLVSWPPAAPYVGLGSAAEVPETLWDEMSHQVDTQVDTRLVAVPVLDTCFDASAGFYDHDGSYPYLLPVPECEPSSNTLQYRARHHQDWI